MEKISKAVFRNGIVMLSLLAAIVLSSSVAQAQNCIARAVDPPTVRAEGMTETVGSLEIRCQTEGGFTFVGETMDLSIKLNAGVTNALSGTDGDEVTLTYANATGTATPIVFQADGSDLALAPVLSEDGMTITWEDIDISDDGGFEVGADPSPTVVIAGIRANASSMGEGGEITAVVSINDVALHNEPRKVADVKAGLVIKTTSASVLQCRIGTTGNATISITEGFAGALTNAADDPDHDELVVNFVGIPADVTVMITRVANPATTEAKEVTLTAASAETTEKIAVSLDEDGDGSVTYTVTNAGTEVQSATLAVDFTWEEGAPIEAGQASVGFNPASSGDEDVTVPRFTAGADMRVIGFDPCETSLLFPFVSNLYGYETGLAFTNASDYAGACMIEFAGAGNNPADMETMEIMAQGTVTYGLSVIAPGFQGYLDVTCTFEKGQGFAFISNGFESLGGATAAHGYLAVVE